MYNSVYDSDELFDKFAKTYYSVHTTALDQKHFIDIDNIYLIDLEHVAISQLKYLPVNKSDYWIFLCW